MPDPFAQSHLVKLNIRIEVNAPTISGDLQVLYVPRAPHQHFAERAKLYRGSSAQILGAMRADGFDTTEEGYLQVSAALAQTPRPEVVWVGRADANDAGVTGTMQAIYDDAIPPQWYAFCYNTRDAAEILALAAWAEPLFLTYFALTQDQAVPDNAPNNVLAQLRAQGYERTVLGWSNPGLVATAAMLVTTLETWDLTPAAGTGALQALTIRVGLTGTNQLFLFFAAQAELELAAGSYALANGDRWDVEIDGDGTTRSAEFLGAPATLTSGQPETYDFSAAPLTCNVRHNGVVTPVTFQLADFAVPGAGTAAEVAARIDADVGAAIASDDAGSVLLTSTISGLASDLQVTEGDGANAILGFPAGLFQGTGNVANIGATTPAEVLSVTQAAFGTTIVAALTASAVAYKTVRYGTSASIDTKNTTTANVLAQFGIAVGAVTGSGFAQNAAATTAAELDVALSTLVGAGRDISSGRMKLTTTATGSASRIEATSSQVDVIDLTSSGADQIGFRYDGLVPLVVGSTNQAADAAALVAAFNASPTYSALGTAYPAPGDRVVVAFEDESMHTFEDQSTGANEVAAVTAADAAQRLGIDPRSSIGSGTLEDYAECALTGFYFAGNFLAQNGSFNPAPVELVGVQSSLRGPQQSIQRANVTNGGGWCIDPDNPNRTVGAQVVKGFTIETRVAADLYAILTVAAGVAFLNENAQGRRKIQFRGQKDVDRIVNTVFKPIIQRMSSPAGSGAFRPLSEDPDADPDLVSTIIAPRFLQLDPNQRQSGVLSGIAVSLVVDPGLVKIEIDATVVAATQPAA